MHASSNCQFTLKTLKPGGLNVSNVKMREGWATILVTTGGSIHVLYLSRSATLLRVDGTLRVEPKWGRASHTNINQIYQSNKHEQCSVFWLAVETQTRIKLWAHTGQWMEPVNTHTHSSLFAFPPLRMMFSRVLMFFTENNISRCIPIVITNILIGNCNFYFTCNSSAIRVCSLPLASHRDAEHTWLSETVF